MKKPRAKKNKTLTLKEEELLTYSKKILRLDNNISPEYILNSTICGDFFEIIDFFPNQFVDLLFIDPPYNLNKQFNESSFKKMSLSDYAQWVDNWLSKLIRLLKPNASIYICCDWYSSSAIFMAAEKYFHVRNRITWEREKGRGALKNWKNCSEDIWFCTMSDTYTFNLDEVKLKRKVLAPYTNKNGQPKDWNKTDEGNYRLTHPSNIWTDLTVPFWSMPENTDHPTQKPEKLLAKIILANSNKGDVVLDPFMGSGTTSVVAKKLGRNYIGIEKEELYACLAEKRLDQANKDSSIQGFRNGVFWERNTKIIN